MVELSMLTKTQEVKGLPNIKSAIKRVKTNKSKSLTNTDRKSALKTAIKKSKETIAKNNSSAAESLRVAVKLIDKAAAHNIIHKNTASRRKSRLAKAFNSIKA